MSHDNTHDTNAVQSTGSNQLNTATRHRLQLRHLESTVAQRALVSCYSLLSSLQNNPDAEITIVLSGSVSDQSRPGMSHKLRLLDIPAEVLESLWAVIRSQSEKDFFHAQGELEKEIVKLMQTDSASPPPYYPAPSASEPADFISRAETESEQPVPEKSPLHVFKREDLAYDKQTLRYPNGVAFELQKLVPPAALQPAPPPPISQVTPMVPVDKVTPMMPSEDAYKTRIPPAAPVPPPRGYNAWPGNGPFPSFQPFPPASR